MSSPSSSFEHSKSSDDECHIYSSMSPRYGSEEELDSDDSFWEFINKLKYHPKEEESDKESERVNEDEEDKSE